jgi:predicted nucleic acid-binding protein
VANIFLDTSALAKLYHNELGSDYVESLFDAEGQNFIFVSPLSLIEMESVIALKSRRGQVSQAGAEIARRKFRLDLAKRRLHVSPEFEKRHFEYARASVAIYGSGEGLRTLDALQLSMAMHLSNAGMLHFLVAADQALCRVARLEKLVAIDPQSPATL